MLTPKQWRDRSVDILTVIDHSLDHRGFPPTILELSDALGMSKATVHHALGHMQRDGLIGWERNSQRTIWATEKGAELLEGALHV